MSVGIPVAESVKIASGTVAAADAVVARIIAVATDTVVAAGAALDVVVAGRETCHLG